MTVESWLNLAIAVIPTILVWVWKSGGKDSEAKALSDRQKALIETVHEFREENRQLFQDWGARIRDLEIRTTELQQFRHNTNNRLTILTSHVDELRVRK